MATFKKTVKEKTQTKTKKRVTGGKKIQADAKKGSKSTTRVGLQRPQAVAKIAKQPLSQELSWVGRKLALDLVHTTAGTLSFKELGARWIVLYFYPKDSTPGCTIEGRDFSLKLAKLEKLGAVVFGVSRDSLQSHARFKEKECFKFDLISDSEQKLCDLFDVMKIKNMYGRKVFGIQRSTFVLNREGEIFAEWRGVKVPGHVDAVVEALSSLA